MARVRLPRDATANRWSSGSNPHLANAAWLPPLGRVAPREPAGQTRPGLQPAGALGFSALIIRYHGFTMVTSLNCATPCQTG